jgi:hypothetical protein
MSTTLTVCILIMAGMRIVLGLAPFVAADTSARLLGFPADHINPTARLFARLFGVRDIGLGVLALYALEHPAAGPFLYLFNACMDGGDVVSVLIPVVRGQGLNRAAALSGCLAMSAGAAWITVWLMVR